MNDNEDDVGRALTGGAEASSVGTFEYDVAADRWWWSDEVYRMHGYEPGEITPTTQLVLEHLSPADRDRRLPADLPEGAFAVVRRIDGGRVGERVLAIVAERRADQVSGQVVDVTGPVQTFAGLEVSRQVDRAEERRAVIDEAIGVIAAWTGMTPEEALAQLRAASMHDNVKLRDVALTVVAAVVPPSGPVQETPAGPWTRSLVELLPKRDHPPN